MNSIDGNKETHKVPPELLRFIKTGSKFIIAGHKEPDGDCTGSQLALRSVLLRLGKEVILCSAGPFLRNEIIIHADEFLNALTDEHKSGAKVIIVDCASKERTGSLEDHLKGLPCAIIDHHAAGAYSSSTEEAPVFIDATSPSCTLLIDRLIAALELELTQEEATLLLFGLCTDTGFFNHLNEKSAHVFEATAKIVKRGASPKNIFNMMKGGKSLESRILMGNMLSRTESYFDGRLLISYETLEEFNTFGLKSRDSDTLIKLMQSIEGTEVIVLIRRECDDSCTVSLRSIDNIDIAQIAVSFGGGGHKNAAGFTMKGNITSIKEIMLESFNNFFIK